MSNKTYIVEADNTLFVVEASSVEKAAAQILEVEKPIREFIRWNRRFSSIKHNQQFQNDVKVNPARKCTVHLSFDELVSYDLPFFTYDFCQA